MPEPIPLNISLSILPPSSFSKPFHFTHRHWSFREVVKQEKGSTGILHTVMFPALRREEMRRDSNCTWEGLPPPYQIRGQVGIPISSLSTGSTTRTRASTLRAERHPQFFLCELRQLLSALWASVPQRWMRLMMPPPQEKWGNTEESRLSAPWAETQILSPTALPQHLELHLACFMNFGTRFPGCLSCSLITCCLLEI